MNKFKFFKDNESLSTNTNRDINEHSQRNLDTYRFLFHNNAELQHENFENIMNRIYNTNLLRIYLPMYSGIKAQYIQFRIELLEGRVYYTRGLFSDLSP